MIFQLIWYAFQFYFISNLILTRLKNKLELSRWPQDKSISSLSLSLSHRIEQDYLSNEIKENYFIIIIQGVS